MVSVLWIFQTKYGRGMFALRTVFPTYLRFCPSFLLQEKLAILIVCQIVIYQIFNSIPFYISSLVCEIIACDTTYLESYFYRHKSEQSEAHFSFFFWGREKVSSHLRNLQPIIFLEVFVSIILFVKFQHLGIKTIKYK